VFLIEGSVWYGDNEADVLQARHLATQILDVEGAFKGRSVP
jgi:hypothetical protein